MECAWGSNKDQPWINQQRPKEHSVHNRYWGDVGAPAGPRSNLEKKRVLKAIDNVKGISMVQKYKQLLLVQPWNNRQTPQKSVAVFWITVIPNYSIICE